jgi:hypothetical protein
LSHFRDIANFLKDLKKIRKNHLGFKILRNKALIWIDYENAPKNSFFKNKYSYLANTAKVGDSILEAQNPLGHPNRVLRSTASNIFNLNINKAALKKIHDSYCLLNCYRYHFFFYRYGTQYGNRKPVNEYRYWDQVPVP